MDHKKIYGKNKQDITGKQRHCSSWIYLADQIKKYIFKNDVMLWDNAIKQWGKR